jgi:hypothetical protein
VQPLWTISERQGGHSARSRICHARAVRAEFIHSTGPRCILDLDAESLQDGFSIALIQRPLPVRRIFELTNTDTLLRFIEP